MDLYERLRQSEQSRRLAWQVLQEIRHVLEILGDQRIPYEGERKRFRAEGDFLVRALVDLISHCRAHPVSCSRNSIFFAVGHLADFQGANDEHI